MPNRWAVDHPSTVVQGFGDNRGNKYALSHLQSSKYPRCVLVMELSAQLEKRSQRLELTWVPREGNEEADRLSNGDCRGFCESNRVQFQMQQQKWIVLTDLMAVGKDMTEEKEKRKSDHKAAQGKAKRPALRVREPW